MFAFSLMAVIALTAASVALGLDSRAARNLQNSADSAALAGATAFLVADSPRASDRLAEAEKAAVGTARGNSEYVLTGFDVSALTEDAYGQHTEVEITLAFEPANIAAKIIGRNGNVLIKRTAAASATWGFPLCILSLSPDRTGIGTSGDADLMAKNCVIWSNSTGSRSMSFAGGDASAKYFCAAGLAPVTNGTQISPRPTEDCDPIPDPLENWSAPEPGPASALSDRSAISRNPVALLNQLQQVLNDRSLKDAFRNLKSALARHQPLPDAATQDISEALNAGLLSGLLDARMASLLDEEGVYVRGPARGLSILEVAQILGLADNLDPATYAGDSYVSSPTLTLSPGTYAGLDISSGHVEMQPGIYHIVDAPLIVRRKATLTGKGVTIIFHGPDATFSVTDQARLTLTAPVEGETAGFALAEDRQDRTPHRMVARSRLTGGGSVSIVGTVYLPRHKLAITGDGAADQASPLLQIVADSVDITDNGALQIRFEPGKTDVPMTILPRREARLLR